MPWHIESDNSGCNGYAVVKDEDGEIVGCHRTRNQANAQLAALHIAEPEERAGSGPATIIVDIDGTLSINGRVNNELVTYLNNRGEIKIVVTGRNESQRESTARFLDSTGLEYRGLRMSSGGNVNTYKRGVAEQLMETHDIVLAVENNPETRKTYEDIGIPTMGPQSRREEAEQILASLLKR